MQWAAAEISSPIMVSEKRVWTPIETAAFVPTPKKAKPLKLLRNRIFKLLRNKALIVKMNRRWTFQAKSNQLKMIATISRLIRMIPTISRKKVVFAIFNLPADAAISLTEQFMPENKVDYESKYFALKSHYEDVLKIFKNGQTKWLAKIKKDLPKKVVPTTLYWKYEYEKLKKTMEVLQSHFEIQHKNWSVSKIRRFYNVPNDKLNNTLNPPETLQFMGKAKLSYSAMDKLRSYFYKSSVCKSRPFSSKRQVNNYRRTIAHIKDASVPVDAYGVPHTFKLKLGSLTSHVLNAYIVNVQPAIQRKLNSCREQFTTIKPLTLCFNVTELTNLVMLTVSLGFDSKPIIFLAVFEGELTYWSMNFFFLPIMKCIKFCKFLNSDGTPCPIKFFLNGSIQCFSTVTNNECYLCSNQLKVFGFDPVCIVPPCQEALTKISSHIVAFIVLNLFRVDFGNAILPPRDLLEKYKTTQADCNRKTALCIQWRVFMSQMQRIDIEGGIQYPHRNLRQKNRRPCSKSSILHHQKLFDGVCQLPRCIAKICGISIPRRANASDWIQCYLQDDPPEKRSRRTYHTICLGLSEEKAIAASLTVDFVSPAVEDWCRLEVLKMEMKAVEKAYFCAKNCQAVVEKEIAEVEAFLTQSQLVKSFFTLLTNKRFDIKSRLPYFQLSKSDCRNLLDAHNIEYLEANFCMTSLPDERVVNCVPAFAFAVKVLWIFHSVQCAFENVSITATQIWDLNNKFRELQNLFLRRNPYFFTDLNFHMLLHHVMYFVNSWNCVIFHNEKALAKQTKICDEKFAANNLRNKCQLQVLLYRAYFKKLGHKNVIHRLHPLAPRKKKHKRSKKPASKNLLPKEMKSAKRPATLSSFPKFRVNPKSRRLVLNQK